MIQSFADETTADIFGSATPRALGRFPRTCGVWCNANLKMLDVAVILDDLESPPGNRLKALKGQHERAIQHSR